jgi:putative intracellular protease/amidase
MRRALQSASPEAANWRQRLYETNDSVIAASRSVVDKLAGVLERIHGDGVKTTEESAVKAGAHYIAPPVPFDAFSITSGRIVTGANPASAHIKVVAAIEAFETV